MAVLSVTEIWNGRDASRNANNVRAYKRTFRVVCSSMLDGPFQVGATSVTGIPPLYSFYVDLTGAVDNRSIVQNYQVSQTDDPFVWLVHVEYSNELPRRSPRRAGASGRSGKAEQANKGQTDDDPLQRPAVIKITGQHYEKALPSDLNGRSFHNYAGEQYEHTVVEDTRTLITIDKNQPGAYGSTPLGGIIDVYRDMLNSDYWWGMLPLTCKINLTAESAYEGGTFYWKFQYLIEVREPYPLQAGNGLYDNVDHNTGIASGTGSEALFLTPGGAPVNSGGGSIFGYASDMVLPGGRALSGWALIKANQGSYYLGADGKQHRKVDAATGSIVNPCMLDQQGGALPQTPVGQSPAAGAVPIQIVFRGYHFAPYAALKIP